MNSMCERREELLISLIYDEGDPAELALARSHLASCEGCRREYENLLETRELLGAWPNVANVPRLVYVTEPAGFMKRVRRWVDEMGALGLRSLLRPALATAAVALVLLITVSVLRFQVGPDGVLHVALGNRGAQPEAVMAQKSMTGEEDAVATVPITREEITQAMEEMALNIYELVQNTRAQDRQLVMASLQEQLDIRDVAVRQTIVEAVDRAFTGMDQYDQRLDVLTAAFQDLHEIVGTELQKTNMILAALLQQGGDQGGK